MTWYVLTCHRQTRSPQIKKWTLANHSRLVSTSARVVEASQGLLLHHEYSLNALDNEVSCQRDLDLITLSTIITIMLYVYIYIIYI